MKRETEKMASLNNGPGPAKKPKMTGVTLKLPIIMPKHRVNQYKQQDDDLELSIQAVGGEVKFSKWVAEMSGFFNKIDQLRQNSKDGPIHYDGTQGSLRFNVQTMRTFWDLGHGIEVDLELSLTLDLIRFLHFEAKAENDDGFEKPLLKALMDSLEKFKLDASSKLAVSWILTTFDGHKNDFELNFARTVELSKIEELAWDWNTVSEQNKEIAKFFQYSNSLKPDEAEQQLCANILIFVKNKFIKHYENFENKSVFLKFKKFSDLNKLSFVELNGEKLIVKRPFKTVDFDGKEITNGIEIQITGNSDRIKGKYVIVGEKNGCPLFKRTTSPDRYIYKCKYNDGTVYWNVGDNYESHFWIRAQSNSSLPPFTEYALSSDAQYYLGFRSEVKMSIKHPKAVFEVQ